MEGLDQLGPLLGLGSGGGLFGGGGDSGDGKPLWMKLLTGGLFGAGEIGNILEERKRAQYQNMLMQLIKDPAKLTQMILKAERPLDNALVQSVNNRVQGDMASRGLSQAPGIFAASEAQALAPFEQQNYNTALQQVMTSLGLPAGTFGKPQDMTGSLMQFLRTFRGGGGGGSTFGGGGGSSGTDSIAGLEGIMFPGLTADFPSTQPGGG